MKQAGVTCFILSIMKRNMLLDGHGQIHSRMNTTVQVKSTSRSKWTDGCAIVSGEGVVDCRCTIFSGWLLCVALPTAINNDMSRWSIVNKVEHIALVDRNRGLNKNGSAHMHCWQVGGVTCINYSTGSQQHGQYTK